MELRILQKNDPDLDKIIHEASSVAEYEFVGQSLKKTGVNGRLFVYSRKKSPLYGCIILNKSSAQDKTFLLDENFGLESASDKMFYLQFDDGRITGFFFEQQSEKDAVFNFLQSIQDEETQNTSDNTLKEKEQLYNQQAAPENQEIKQKDKTSNEDFSKIIEQLFDNEIQQIRILIDHYKFDQIL
ncbi:MAG: hypothetical protein EZS28_004465 [Streblomastix strix]|uniref:PH domain-containing protein n=1 Tax=Streblomastix strix TaxID=222440 RepID=A0A5J4WYS4_9EUKA|nr:MAG: hypothetical protein EZS28_004465 [Streblomastix strix]